MRKSRKSKFTAARIGKTASIFLFAASILLSTNAEAQPPVKEKIEPETIAQKKTNDLDRHLNLSEKQYKKVYRLILSQEK